jgi:uncharacterized protein (DUF1501 family)
VIHRHQPHALFGSAVEDHPPVLGRRQFLQALGGSGAALALGGGAGLSIPSHVQAQATDYRALVCLFLNGGNDGFNTVVPLDDAVSGAGYSDYQAIRKGLALPRTSAGVQGLVELQGARFGLHPGLAPLASIWNDQGLALVHNVGPLARPITQAQYVQWRNLNISSQVPESLFSHPDQQRQWETGASATINQTGWGGVSAELNDFKQVVSFAGNTRFGAGLRNNELSLPEPGATFGLNGYYAGTASDARRIALEALIAQSSGNVLHSSLAGQQKAALLLSARLEAAIKIKPGDAGSNAILNAAFGNLAGPYNTKLAKQLYQVAKMIEPTGRTALGGSRHIFFVNLNGFDTHGNQLTVHASLMADVGRSVAAFYSGLKTLGLHDKVTLFTASDFGRTFKPNNTGGTDHGWGNEHLVVGAGVNPKAVLGQFPSLVLGGPNDAADPTKNWEFQGRWIPNLGVCQYAGALLRWLNPQADVLAALPGLSGFGGAALGTDIGLMRA